MATTAPWAAPARPQASHPGGAEFDPDGERQSSAAGQSEKLAAKGYGFHAVN